MSKQTILASIANISSNYLPRTNGTVYSNSLIYDNGTNIGIGTTSPFAIADTNLTVNGTTSSAIQLGYNGTRYGQFYTDSGEIRLSAVANLPLTFYSNNLERMRISATGNIGIGTSSPASKLQVEGGELRVTTSNSGVAMYYSGSGGEIASYNWGGSAYTNLNYVALSHTFSTSGTERMRIQSDGRIIKAANNTQTGQFQIGGQTGSPPNAILVSAADENGPYPIGIKALSATPSQGLFGFFNSANATQGSITINGSDVSYNSFMGSHWSQLSDNSKPEILKGTILEAIDELCKWEGEINDRLPKIKISDTIESKNVYGVFFDWDNMDDFNDMYVAALGAGYIRVNSNEVVSMGDLLQSNGDGTAKVQSDDIMRSSTIAKVISTQKIETYPDGSYLIAATLHCG